MNDVLIVGGSTVGLATAAALQAQGFSTVVVERGPPPPPCSGGEIDARVYALSPASIAFLQSLNAWPAVARHSPYNAMQVWQAAPEQALKFAAHPGQVLGSIVELPVLNHALAGQVAASSSHFGQPFTLSTAEEGAVHGQLGNGQPLAARLLVLADGPDSPLRQQLGLSDWAQSYGQTAIVAHVQFAQPSNGIARQRFLETGPVALLPLADGRASLVWSATQSFAEALLALPDAEFAEHLQRVTQGVLGPVLSLTARKAFPLRVKAVLQPTAAGVVAVGDAAHVIHPLAGQGVNLGLADAAQLASTLAAARDAQRGWWRARTLAHYARARSAPTLEMLALTHGLHHAFTSQVPGLRNLLGQGMALVERLGPVKQALVGRAAG